MFMLEQFTSSRMKCVVLLFHLMLCESSAFASLRSSLAPLKPLFPHASSILATRSRAPSTAHGVLTLVAMAPPGKIIFIRNLSLFEFETDSAYSAAVPPKPVGVYMCGATKPIVVLETYMDYCCPFAKKMFDTLYNEVMPEFKAGGQVDWLFQNVVQPWHAQSSPAHKVALAVKRIDESKFFAASNAIFAVQTQFSDDKTMDKSRNQIYDELTAVVARVEGLDAAAVRSEVNAGNAVNQVSKRIAENFRCICE
jgi:protein-disulfide isomerase